MSSSKQATGATPEDDSQKVTKRERKAPTPRKPVQERQKRKHRYQTEDLIRERSPQQAESQPAPADEQDVENSKDISMQVVNGKRTVQCNICQRRMTESKLANHIRLLHVTTSTDENKASEDTEKKRKDFKCDYCGKSYAIKYTYEQHVKTHTEGRPKCPECGATFASAFSLFRHRARNHNLDHNYTTHECDQCDKTFFSVSELGLHRQRHSPKKEFFCSECKKAFSVKGNLRIHMRTHAKEKLYKCDICENTFSHPYSLVSHRRIHTNDFPFKCPNCEKAYRSKHQLTSHMNVHSDARPFKCNECSKTFRSRTAFKMHQDQHQGIKRFTCKFCDRRFQCHANKLKHERRHIGVKRHKCQICDKGFIEKQELRNHLKVHDKQSQKDAPSSDTKSSEQVAEPSDKEATGTDEATGKTPATTTTTVTANY